MSTIARLAGISDSARSASPPPTEVQYDPENFQQPASNRVSRASLPLDRRLSRRSFIQGPVDDHIQPPPVPDLPSQHDAHYIPSQNEQQGLPYSATKSSLADHATHTNLDFGPTVTDTDNPTTHAVPTGLDLSWGPMHPCFPHPNSHVAKTSEEYTTTRIIRIQRDYMVAGDLYPAFQNLYPEILAGWINEETFRDMIAELNRRLEYSFNPGTGRAAFDAIIGALTGFLWEDFGLTRVKSGMKGIEAWIDTWNQQRERENNQVRLVQPRRTGFLNLDIIIPDPGVDNAMPIAPQI